MENFYHFTDLPFKFQLIHRASQDGFNVKNFHKNCDNKGPTVVVIKVQNSGEIVGGYNPLEWRSVKKVENKRSSLLSHHNNLYIDHECETPNSFIFSLKNQTDPILSRVISEKEAIILCGNKDFVFV